MLYIKTFGGFDIIKDDVSIFLDVKYPYRVIILFKYLLTYHDHKLISENIIEDLFAQEDYNNPKAVLRTQVSRLRKYFKLLNIEEYFSLLFSHGYYILKVNKERCILDFDVFADKIHHGNSLKDENPLKAIELYLEAIELYSGNYLDGNKDESWIIPLRNRYERLYLQGVFRAIQLLDKNNKYEKIIEVCEKALSLYPYNENLNIYFIEALLNFGETKYAFSHYEYITEKIYKELNMVPSDEMKRLYKKMLNKTTKRTNIEPAYVDEKFNWEPEEKGAFQCDIDHFIILYNLEKRRVLRENYGSKFLGIVTIISSKHEDQAIEDFSHPMDNLREVVLTSLRGGDVFTIWNEKQIAIILSNIEYKDLHIVRGRIIKKFNLNNNNQNFYLFVEFKPIGSE